MQNWYTKSKKYAQSDSEVEEYDLSEIIEPYWIPVESSFIKEVGYSESLEIFEIRFKNGRKYTYRDIPKGVFNEFMDSDSKGRFYSNVIKPMYRLVRR